MVWAGGLRSVSEAMFMVVVCVDICLLALGVSDGRWVLVARCVGWVGECFWLLNGSVSQMWCRRASRGVFRVLWVVVKGLVSLLWLRPQSCSVGSRSSPCSGSSEVPFGRSAFGASSASALPLILGTCFALPVLVWLSPPCLRGGAPCSRGVTRVREDPSLPPGVWVPGGFRTLRDGPGAGFAPALETPPS